MSDRASSPVEEYEFYSKYSGKTLGINEGSDTDHSVHLSATWRMDFQGDSRREDSLDRWRWSQGQTEDLLGDEDSVLAEEMGGG